MSLRPVPIVPRKSALSSIEGFNRCAPFIMRISPFQSFQTFNRFAPFKAFQVSAGSKRSKVPVVPIGEDVPEATILPERRRKTSGIVPDWPHHVVCTTRYCSSVRQVGVGATSCDQKRLSRSPMFILMKGLVN